MTHSFWLTCVVTNSTVASPSAPIKYREFSVIYLLLYIVFSSVFTLCIKWVYNRGTEDIISIGAINYIVAAIAIAPWFFIDGQQTGEINAMIYGGSMGLIYFIAFFFVIYCVRIVGASSSTVVGSLSLLMPIVVAAWIWHSIPNSIQIAGILLALVSLMLIAVKPKPVNPTAGDESESKSSLTPLLLLFGFFLLCGMSRIAQEAFKYESVPNQKPTYLLTAFVVAAIPSAILLIARGRKILGMEYVVGMTMGLANVTQTFFILMALQSIEGYIVFPLSSAGGIAFTTLIATQFLGERLSPRAYAGIGLAVVALVFLKWETSGEHASLLLP